MSGITSFPKSGPCAVISLCPCPHHSNSLHSAPRGSEWRSFAKEETDKPSSTDPGEGLVGRARPHHWSHSGLRPGTLGQGWVNQTLCLTPTAFPLKELEAYCTIPSPFLVHSNPFLGPRQSIPGGEILGHQVRHGRNLAEDHLVSGGCSSHGFMFSLNQVKPSLMPYSGALDEQ